MSESRRIDEASRRIIREDLSTNLLVEAGAGSGKTQMLAERMAAGVAAGVYDIGHMAAVTFTRKAASELRGRFHLALEARLVALDDPSRGFRLQAEDADDGSALERRRLAGALGNLERFFAGTIHSFCARLLRERPVESGVSPGFTELDEVQDLELRKRAWREFVTESRANGDPLVLDLLETGVKPGDLDDAFRVVCENEDVEFPPGEAACPDPAAAFAALQAFWDRLQEELPETIGDATTCAIQRAARDFRPHVRIARHRADRPAVVAALLQHWQCNSKIIQKWWSDDPREKKRLRDLIEELHTRFREDVVDPYLGQWRQYVYRLAITLLTRARSRAADERRRLNTLNYGDLLNLTAKVLRENGQVRRALQQKYRHLFVDEFQDTDPIQAEIVFLLAAEDDSASVNDVASSMLPPRVQPAFPAPSAQPPVPDWRHVPLRPGALFVVGDPKQSIYRFRRADIEIYNLVRQRFEEPGTGRVVPLTLNYRSAPALCEWANGVFQAQFPAEATAHAPKFAPLDAANPKGGKVAFHSAGVYTLTHGDGVEDLLGADAEAIARYIRAEVDAGRRRYSDFLILTRKKKHRIAPYAAALEALNVPLEVSGAGAFGESREVETLTTLLRALADPQDQLALVAVLRGPLFGISDPELYEYKAGGGWLGLWAGQRDSEGRIESDPDAASHDPAPGAQRPAPSGSAPAPSPQPPVPVRAALAALSGAYRWTRILPAAAALDRILEDSGYLALAATSPDGVEAGDLIHAVDRVRQVVEEGGSLADAADALEDDVEAASEVESLPLEPGRSDVVRVMNLHKAKGLEAAVVFLADPRGGFTERVDSRIARAGDRAQGWFPVVRKFESGGSLVLGQHADWEAHAAAELPFVQEETKRLLYVAATRAREMLVVSCAQKGRGTPAWGVLNQFLDAATELPVPAAVATTPVQPQACSLADQIASATAIATAHAAAARPSWSITSVTAEARHIARMTRAAESAATDDATAVVEPNTPSHRADAGMAWGTLIHGLLEHAMRFPSCSRDDLRRMALWLSVEESQLRVVLEEALDTVASVRGSEFWDSARGAEHYVEAPFAVGGPSREVLNGTIDLLHRQPAGWAVVDYKSDAGLAAAGQAPGAYATQLDSYRRALEACGLPVSGTTLRPVRLGTAAKTEEAEDV